MPMFQRRHYDQLAWWAGRNLDLQSQAVASLLDLLTDDNPAFSGRRFITACETHRVLAELNKAPGYNTKPKPIEANLDDVISNSENPS